MSKTKPNKICTSKYTKSTFIPLNLYYQFTKYNNLFFFITLLLLCIPSISPFTPYTYLIAFSLILSISMIKDAFEDLRRHEQDALINKKETKLIKRRDDNEHDISIHERNNMHNENDMTNINMNRNILHNNYQSSNREAANANTYNEYNRFNIVNAFVEDIDVGEYVLIKENEEVPADILVLSSRIHDNCSNYCFIETSNLDGETNLKRRQIAQIKDCICSANSAINENELIPCEAEKINLIKNFSIDGSGELLSDIKCEVKTENRNYVFTHKFILLKGSKLKNTDRIVGLVLSVGSHTKQDTTKFIKTIKISAFERNVNILLLFIFIIYFIVLFLTSILSSVFLNKPLEYLQLSRNISTESIKALATNYILFSYLVPISLFVTIEIARIFMAMYIKHDDEMKKDGIESNCKNSNVVEDIGMVEQVLTDKTGTLTRNEMVLKSVHTHNEVVVSRIENYKRNENISEQRQSETNMDENKSTNINNSKNNLTSNINNNDNHKPNNSFKNSFSINQHDKNNSLQENAEKQISNSYLFHKTNKISNMFLISLLTCNSVERFNGKYEGPSQDEICILNGLFKMGELVSRTDNVIKIKLKYPKAETLNVLILLTLDFTSTRQRMSVIVNFNNKYFLFTKGSDNIILININGDIQRIKRIINSNSMYRTLVAAYKELSENDVKIILDKAKKIGLENRETEMETIFQDIECNLTYLGSTFVEDGLQDGVNDCVNSLKKAGIGVWMVTGDKKETAVSCGKLCGIMDNDEQVREVIESNMQNEREGNRNENDGRNNNFDNNINQEDNSRVRINFNEEDRNRDETDKSVLKVDTNEKSGKSFNEKLNKFELMLKNSTISRRKNENNLELKNNIISEKDKYDQRNNTRIFDRNTGITKNKLLDNNKTEINNDNNERKNLKSTKSDFIIDTKNKVTKNYKTFETLSDKNTKNETKLTSLNVFGTKSNAKDTNKTNEETENVNQSEPQMITGIGIHDPSCLILPAEMVIKMLEGQIGIMKRAIIYRSSPEQKATIARLLVERNKTVLAIGDGNNDVLMLQSSSIGVGIIGREGTQASMCADFSVPDFVCLKRLLFVHGRYNYIRLGKLTTNSLYKNLLLVCIQFNYNFFNGYSGRPVYNSFFLNYFNVLFTSLIPTTIALFDKDEKEEVLLNNPERYKEAGRHFNKKVILMNILVSILKGNIMFWLTYFVIHKVDFTKGNGLIGGYSALNNYFSIMIFLGVFFRQIRMISFYCGFSYCAILITFFLYFATIFGIQEFSESTRNAAFHLYGMPMFYFMMMSVFGIVFFIDYVYDISHNKLLKMK